MDSKLSRRQVELVLRRAAEIDATETRDRTSAADRGELSADDVRRLGEEAGLETEAVARALGELRRGALGEPEDGTLARAIGPSQVVVSREVPLPRETAQRAVNRFLRDQLMVIRRHHGERIEWERAHGIWPGLIRALALSSRYAFSPVGAVETIVAEETADTAAVTFILDLSEMRRERLLRAGLRATGAFGVIGLGGAALLPGGVPAEALALGGGALLAAGLVALERRRWTESRDRVALAPERFLDLLVQRHRKP